MHPTHTYNNYSPTKKKIQMTSVKRRVCDLRHVKLPSQDKTQAQRKTRAWDGGKIVTNKAEALRRFLARKKRQGELRLTEEQKKVMELAMRKNKDDTVFVKDFNTMREDSAPKDVKSILNSKPGNQRNRKNRNKFNSNNKKNKKKKGNQQQKRKRKHAEKRKKNDNKQPRKKKRSDSISLLNGALTSRR